MLINNAGVVSGRALLDTPDDLIERSFNVNVLAHFWVMSHFIIYFHLLLLSNKSLLKLSTHHFVCITDNKNLFTGYA